MPPYPGWSYTIFNLDRFKIIYADFWVMTFFTLQPLSHRYNVTLLLFPKQKLRWAFCSFTILVIYCSETPCYFYRVDSSSFLPCSKFKKNFFFFFYKNYNFVEQAPFQIKDQSLSYPQNYLPLPMFISYTFTPSTLYLE